MQAIGFKPALSHNFSLVDLCPPVAAAAAAHGSLYRHLPPSQGGKYVGFGSSPAPQSSSQAGGQFDSSR